MKPFPVRATHYPFCIYTEVFGPVALILHSLIVHGELHVLFHSVLLTVQIIVIRTVPCICHGIFGIDPIQAVEFLHQGHKTVCVGSVLLPAQFFRMSVRYLLTFASGLYHKKEELAPPLAPIPLLLLLVLFSQPHFARRTFASAVQALCGD